MVQEYLFIGDASQKTIEEYNPEGVTVEINCINNSDCWTAVYSVPGESKKSAELLSSVNDYIVKKCNPTVLSNGSSAYFNRVLFPYINEFERKLRKLLYLKSAISKGDKYSENIHDLESKDLGSIFELLFTDENFVKDVRTQVNKKSWQFTKAEILSAVKSIAEETVWSHLIGEDAVPLLRQDFISVKNYRNDVMHAHNIDKKSFRIIKNLFKKINRQLDAEIGKIISVAETHPMAEDSNYNADLNKAITEMNFASLFRALAQEPSPTALQIPEIITNLGMNQTAIQRSPEFLGIQEVIRDLQDITASPEFLEMQKNLRRLQDIKASPEFLEMQQNLQHLQEENDIYRKYFEDMQNGQG